MGRSALTLITTALLCAGEARAATEPMRTRTFELCYTARIAKIPEGARSLDLWVPLPQTDRNQVVHRLTIDAPNPLSVGRESRFGNEILHIRVDHAKAPVVVNLTIVATRTENTGTSEPLADEDRARYLQPEPLVPLDGPVRALALQATSGLSDDEAKAKAIYDKVVGMMKYDKSGTGWGRGDALFACDAKRGNCTDFHALVIGMARSVGIPARFAIGLPLNATRGEGDIPGYHCWAELFVRGRGWVPVDASEAAKDPSRRAYFFGHHDENRLEFSRGRNLTLVPAQQGPSLNFFVYPYAEVDGHPLDAIERSFRFVDRGAPEAGLENGR